MRKFLLSLTIINLFFITGCGAKDALPDNPIVFEQEVNEEYISLSVDDKVYIPYCPLEQKYLGTCIGYCDIKAQENSDFTREYIYDLRGFSSDEWIIELSPSNICREGMILREVHATDIPEGLTSEYEWNE